MTNGIQYKDKCVCMHLRIINNKFNYSMGGIKLKKLEQEKNVGI